MRPLIGWGPMRVRLLRADSEPWQQPLPGTSGIEAFILHRGVGPQSTLQRTLVQETGWWKLDEGIELVSFTYQSPAWSGPRRVMGIRQQLERRKNAKGKTLSLFADDPCLGQYRFAALATVSSCPMRRSGGSIAGGPMPKTASRN